jgi:hypothetical protein
MPRRGAARARRRPGAGPDQSRPGMAVAPETRTFEGSVHGDDPGPCGLAFVLAEGLRHIAERRSKAGPQRGTMRVRRPTAMTARPMPDPRTPARTRTRRRVRPRTGASAR